MMNWQRCEEAVIFYFKVLSWPVFEETELNHDYLKIQPLGRELKGRLHEYEVGVVMACLKQLRNICSSCLVHLCCTSAQKKTLYNV
jgi:hypothetical protein